MDSTIGIPSDAAEDGNRSEHVSQKVINEVATATGVDPLDLEPLYSVIDPDALNAMFRRTDGSTSASLTLHFTMEGCEVIVHGDGEVCAIPPLELADGPTEIALCDD